MEFGLEAQDIRVKTEGNMSDLGEELSENHKVHTEALYSDIGAQISIPTSNQIDIFVPEDVAIETVITISPTKHRKTENARRRRRKDSLSVHLSDSDYRDDASSIVSVDDTFIWPQFELGKSSGYGSELSEVDVVTSNIPSAASGTVVSVSKIAPSNGVISEREMNKRLRDRMKKRELRTNPEFRLKEKEKAKLRMAKRRNNPEYREVERQRDRERRRLARKQNESLRQRERERDRAYKKSLRNSDSLQVKDNPELIYISNDSSLSGLSECIRLSTEEELLGESIQTSSCSSLTEGFINRGSHSKSPVTTSQICKGDNVIGLEMTCSDEQENEHVNDTDHVIYIENNSPVIYTETVLENTTKETDQCRIISDIIDINTAPRKIPLIGANDKINPVPVNNIQLQTNLVE
ncbi:hypothetical protein CHS0354_012784 [Potamilus streckersoni]|uniref:Uncharacterized protein n=1 Tax=Potamilus streckersoni TaxID=2493646 RepID=A0AAE0RVA3_9BIVA|nr:hypothetical protein CHS0354_012784 [Potamilus streckersoni]